MSVVTTLGEVAEITMGQAPIGESYNNTGNGLPLVAGAGDFGELTPEVKKFTSTPTKVSQPGDIIMSIRATIGTKVTGDRIYCLGRGVAGLRAKKKLDQGYLWHWLAHAGPVLASKGRGATFLQVSRSDIASLQIPVPPLDEQKRIAAILDNADQLRRKRRQAIALLDSLTQAIFLEMFGDPISNSYGFESIELDDLVDRKRGISYGIVQRGDEFTGGVQVVRIGDILDGEVRTAGLVRTDPEIASKFQRTKLLGGEMVISIRGTVGRCAVVPKSLTNANVSREIAVIPSLEPERNEFHLALLRTDSAQRRLKDDVKGVAQSGINLEDLRKLPIIRPPLHMVEKFLLMCSKLRMQRIRVKLCDDLVGKAFSSLQHRAFTGQL